MSHGSARAGRTAGVLVRPLAKAAIALHKEEWAARHAGLLKEPQAPVKLRPLRRTSRCEYLNSSAKRGALRIHPRGALMFRPSPELVIFLFGVLSVFAALEHVPDVANKTRLMKGLFVLGLLTQFSTHFFQFSYAVTNRVETERRVDAETAIALYAYTEDDVELLRSTTRHSYLVGYRLFKNRRLEESVPFFEEAIQEGRYVASSNYMLAHIATHDDQGGLARDKDWTIAYEYLDASIENNPNYAPAYYLLAVLYANTHRIDEALEVLPQAVMRPQIGLVGCRNLNRERNLEVEWAPLVDNPRFAAIQQHCRAIHGLN